jgi:hypothetical protein
VTQDELDLVLTDDLADALCRRFPDCVVLGIADRGGPGKDHLFTQWHGDPILLSGYLALLGRRVLNQYEENRTLLEDM